MEQPHSASKTPASHPVLETRGLSKSFGAVVAVDSIDLEIYAGELLALIGDNGAGKSTLVKLLSGALRPDSGELILRGEKVSFSSPHEARMRGLETVYQDLALAQVLDVAGNLFLGRELVYRVPFLPRLLSPLNRRAMARRATERIQDLEIQLPAVSNHPVDRLSGGQRQAVAIARGAAWATEVLFMDEPTAALGGKQSTAVLTLARRLVTEGLAVVLITHTLPYVMEYADRIVVLRRGSKVADLPRAQATPEQLVSLIVGFDPASAEVV
jgi:ABC-type sugar transport system ATPase subunit